jgi:methylmalonyl-CoA mutase N-terminal domain/subunit
VNKYTLDEEEAYDPLRVDPQIEVDQRERLKALRAERDDDAVKAALAELQEAARGSDNVLYPMREALRLRATGGEVAHALRQVWGVYQPRETF